MANVTRHDGIVTVQMPEDELYELAMVLAGAVDAADRRPVWAERSPYLDLVLAATDGFDPEPDPAYRPAPDGTAVALDREEIALVAHLLEGYADHYEEGSPEDAAQARALLSRLSPLVR